MNPAALVVWQFGLIALLLVALVLERSSAKNRLALLRDAWASEVQRNTQHRCNLDAIKAAHAELQHVFLMQGKELTIALAAAKAAERVLAD